MKSALTLSFLLIALLAHTQKNFEGLIKYSVEISDSQLNGLEKALPTSLTYYLAEGGAKLIPEGGEESQSTTVLKFGKKEQSVWLLSDQAKTAQKISDGFEIGEGESSVTYQKVSEETETLGKFECFQYVAELGSSTIRIWITKDVQVDQRVLSFEEFLPMKGGANLGGLPVKIVEELPSSFTRTITIEQFLEVSIASSEFEIPDDYQTSETSLEELYSHD